MYIVLLHLMQQEHMSDGSVKQLDIQQYKKMRNHNELYSIARISYVPHLLNTCINVALNLI